MSETPPSSAESTKPVTLRSERAEVMAPSVSTLPAAPMPNLPPSPWDHAEFLKLDVNQRAWVKVFVMRGDGNGTRAVREAGIDVKAPSVQANRYRRACADALRVCTPMWLTYKAALDAHTAAGVLPADHARPPMTKDELVRIMSALARGEDPRSNIEKGPHVLVFRVQDLISAGKLLTDLNGWAAPKKLELSKRPDDGKSEAELMAEADALRKRRESIEAGFRAIPGLVRVEDEVYGSSEVSADE